MPEIVTYVVRKIVLCTVAVDIGTVTMEKADIVLVTASDLGAVRPLSRDVRVDHSASNGEFSSRPSSIGCPCSV